MNKYTKLSDFEINLAVAHIALGKGNYDWCSDKKEVYLAGIDGGDFLPRGYFDPCNNSADAMPIIIENGIAFAHIKLQLQLHSMQKSASSTVTLYTMKMYCALLWSYFY
ncbi:hypothetical protein [Providencia stuartii]|uniref:hypothetical protein n=1 Tax=Providencia stuartii TaxID=588 RepID=UPI0024B24149